ncbi:hypothetical protein Nham_4183 (plasmid) [Nitrobacter hamburgensis X14]|uniref:Uncharacterized protein n=1 Tax=Nitrobacter hamburgensis (strain DSM 10229 / NCIMB 13809 / X14) TaxID=323097 RepID=Q1QG41_NITHX|nr:hypothetical protein [Nitrobacter hamburgensis]ABE64806.1 hypothetical protein Nham_4183 [Nitrobacter hamburgensis X14]
MSARVARPFWRWPMLIAAAGALVALAVGLVASPKSVMQGWLIAFVFVSGITIGSLVLLLIHRLTGGRWGAALAPVLMPAAAMLPLLALAFLPLAFGLSALYRWASDTSMLRPAVAHVYLNQPAFLLRSAVALLGWSVLAVAVVRKRCTALMAGLGLVFHAVVISLVAVDWVLSIDSRFSSSAFAAAIAIQQLLSALALAAIAGPEARQPGAIADLAGLILATLLGTVYLALMSFIVIWYGNLPDKAAWYLLRGRDGWQWLIASAVVIGALVPLCLLLKQSFRQSRIALRLIGSLILLGIFLHVAWLIAPAFGSGAIVAASSAVVALVGLGLGLFDRVVVRLSGAAHAE